MRSAGFGVVCHGGNVLGEPGRNGRSPVSGRHTSQGPQSGAGSTAGRCSWTPGEAPEVPESGTASHHVLEQLCATAAWRSLPKCRAPLR